MQLRTPRIPFGFLEWHHVYEGAWGTWRRMVRASPHFPPLLRPRISCDVARWMSTNDCWTGSIPRANSNVFQDISGIAIDSLLCAANGCTFTRISKVSMETVWLELILILVRPSDR